jgi:hypothetical protein
MSREKEKDEIIPLPMTRPEFDDLMEFAEIGAIRVSMDTRDQARFDQTQRALKIIHRLRELR